jgi:two-component system, sensor histidine kinase and response regulator
MKTILVIDDEEEVRLVVENFLRAVQFQVLQAEDGSIGVQLAKEHIPDLIISM